MGKFFMLHDITPTLIIYVLYNLFVFVGPRVMKNRQAFSLKYPMIVYNFIVTLLSGYIFYEFLMSGWLFDYSLGCQPVDYSDSPQAIRMTKVCWLFFFTKYIDLLDTVFFVLRKKNNQLTFLHVFHHGTMIITCWIGAKTVPGGFGSFCALLNSFIHFVMYFYYFLSSFGDLFKKYLWWKKYLTAMQMIQFLLIIIHGSQLFWIECNYPIHYVYYIGGEMLIFLGFFSNFYIHAYTKKDKTGSKQEANGYKSKSSNNHKKKEA